MTNEILLELDDERTANLEPTCVILDADWELQTSKASEKTMGNSFAAPWSSFVRYQNELEIKCTG